VPVPLGRAGEGEQRAVVRVEWCPPTRTARSPPKVVICVVPAGRRVPGDGHSLHVVADLTLASREHARFTQTDADVASFDGGFGSAYQARQVGQKFAREIFFFGHKRRSQWRWRCSSDRNSGGGSRAHADRRSGSGSRSHAGHTGGGGTRPTATAVAVAVLMPIAVAVAAVVPVAVAALGLTATAVVVLVPVP
jgi:hypothetical protein